MSDSTTRRQLLACALALSAGKAWAQSAPFPNRPVRFVLPFPPGTANDVGLRIVAERLAAKWGQAVVVDNRPGASSIIGTDAVAKAPADGHTLLVNITLVLQNTALGRKLPYDLQRDLQPVAQLTRSQLAVLARSDLPAQNLTELFALARRSDKPLNFASWGQASTAHLAYEKMRVDQKIDFTHVPYKGGGEIITGLLSGDVQIGIADLLSPAAHLRSGRLKVIGITGAQRLPNFPNVPTLAESGVTGFEGYNWLGVFAPAGVDPSIVKQVNQAINEVLAEPAVARRLSTELVTDPAPKSVDEWRDTVERDLRSWTAVVRAAGVRPEH